MFYARSNSHEAYGVFVGNTKTILLLLEDITTTASLVGSPRPGIRSSAQMWVRSEFDASSLICGKDNEPASASILGLPCTALHLVVGLGDTDCRWVNYDIADVGIFNIGRSSSNLRRATLSPVESL